MSPTPIGPKRLACIITARPLTPSGFVTRPRCGPGTSHAPMWQNHKAARHRVSAIPQPPSLTMGGSGHSGLYGPGVSTMADGGARAMEQARASTARQPVSR